MYKTDFSCLKFQQSKALSKNFPINALSLNRLLSYTAQTLWMRYQIQGLIRIRRNSRRPRCMSRCGWPRKKAAI